MARGYGADTFSLSGDSDVKIGGDGSGLGGVAGGNGDGIGGAGGAIDPLRSRQGNEDGGTEFVPGKFNKDGSPRKRRQRKETGNQAAVDDNSVEGTAALLVAIHTVLAVNVPEMEMGEEEALRIAKAYDRVERYYPTIRRVLSGKVKDHVAFFSVVGTAYGSRIAAIRLRKNADNVKDINARPATSTATPGPGHPDYVQR